MISKNKVIFLDRDGTVNREVNYLYRKEDLEFLDGVPEAIRLWKDAGFMIIIVTNQAGVARGYYTEADVRALHQYLNDQLIERCGVGVDGFYFCPHHPEHGIGVYKRQCDCRKPGIGMFKQAEQAFDIDKRRSWMIGDKLIDTRAGKNYGVRTILVGTGYGREEYQNDAYQNDTRKGDQPYDFYAETLMDAAGITIAKET